MTIFKKYIIFFTLILSPIFTNAQIGVGLTAHTDIYQRIANPPDGLMSRSAGSVLLNLGGGPKIWIGARDFSVSFEAQASLGIVGLSVSDYKGLGMLSFPIMAKLNFGGVSALGFEGKQGFSIGGGIQYSKSELYYLSSEAKDLGVKRDYFKTFIAQAGYGFGISGFAILGYLRYGWNAETKANVFNFGIQYDFNLPQLKKITNPESDL